MPSASWIVGRDVATTWMSRIAMNMPRHINRKAAQVENPGAAMRGAVARTCCDIFKNPNA